MTDSVVRVKYLQAQNITIMNSLYRKWVWHMYEDVR